MSWQKRLFDILLSLGLLVCLAPLYLVIACLVKVTSRGPVLHLSALSKNLGNALFGGDFEYLELRLHSSL